ncbi:potassium-transporting ATPase subunit KdpC [Castellaniella hirudinis]|uniref:Potassium-transporting ATPase KdpC subunit n=1 Tax=Castellaniella hirudinis TaxID=1144617 RepID=A0ABV8S2M7_9BURK
MASPQAPLQTPSHLQPTPARVSDRGALRGAIGLSILTLAGFGFLYSLAGVGIGQALFQDAANGSLVERDGRIVGSALVAQPFVGDRYFQPRPSAADYNPMALAGSNQARTNPDLRKRLEDAREAIARREGVEPAAVPDDLFTQSGSGVDPHITPQAAVLQINRIARARGVGRDAIARLVKRHTQEKQWGIFGQARVNVLELNLALDALAPLPSGDARGTPGPAR